MLRHLHTLLLHVDRSCCAKFETSQTFSQVQTDATTPIIVGQQCCGLLRPIVGSLNKYARYTKDQHNKAFSGFNDQFYNFRWLGTIILRQQTPFWALEKDDCFRTLAYNRPLAASPSCGTKPQETNWEKTGKGNFHSRLNDVSSCFVFSQCDLEVLYRMSDQLQREPFCRNYSKSGFQINVIS